MPIFLSLAMEKDDIDIQQTCSYGIGSVAKIMSKADF